MKDKILYRKRKWINPDKSSNAFVNARVERFQGIRDQDHHISGEIAIADCGRVIHLDIDGWNKRAKKNTLKKLDNLINVLSEVRDIVDAEEV